MLTSNVTEYINILMISESKLDDTFPHALYHLKDISNPYRLHRNSQGGGTLVYGRDNFMKYKMKANPNKIILEIL